MSETLWGVVIGGAIGIVSSLMGLYGNYLLWRRTKKIESLRLRRERMLSLCRRVMEEMPGVIETKTWPVDFTTDIMVFLPRDAHERITAARQSGDDDERRKAFWDIVLMLKKEVSKIDKKIDSIIA